MNRAEKVQRILFIVRILAIVMLLWALVPINPYGYYVLMRWVLCGLFLFCAYSAFKLSHQQVWILIFGINAGIYNPILPLHLGRVIWTVINIVSIVFIVGSFFKLRDTN
ncbi:DUF6804 family protein [Thermodesulfobacteriota bacterium]